MFSSVAASTQQSLQENLSVLNQYQGCQCAFIDYPSHPNIGDHMILMGTFRYLIQLLGARIAYISDQKKFSAEALARFCPEGPIFIHGGGNLGDLWSSHQSFKELIIQQYRNRPIVIFPQTVYFKNSIAIEKAARIFNSHPNLTLFVRDHYSYEIAKGNFHGCQVLKAPDMAFYLHDSLLKQNTRRKAKVLYLHRQDAEENPSVSSDIVRNLVSSEEDWPSYKWVYGNMKIPASQALAAILRELWQRRASSPQEWISRTQWQKKLPFDLTEQTCNAEWIYKSWGLIHCGVYQFSQFDFLITDRLHGHILAVLLEIPHVFLPNAYFKNQGFYESWTYKSQFCHFFASVNHGGEIAEIIEKYTSAQ